MSFRPLRGDRRAALSASEQSGKREIVPLLGFARFRFSFQNFLHGFKGCEGKNWWKCAIVIFAVVGDKTEIRAIGKQVVNTAFRKWRSVFRFNAKLRQKLRHTFERVSSFGEFLKR